MSAHPSPSHPDGNRVGAIACLIGGISSFQIGASLAKTLFPLFGPTGMVGLRVCLAAVILLTLWRPSRKRLSPGLWRLLLPYGASVAWMNFAFYIAMTRLPLGMVVALEFMGPLSLALFGSRRWLDLGWAALVLCGLVLLLKPDSPLGHLDPIGIFIAMSGGLGWVVYILTGTRISPILDAGYATSYGMATAGIFLLPCLIPVLPIAISHPYQGGLALSVAIMSSAVPYVLDMLAMRSLSPRDLGILLSMEPMLGALSGLVFLHESLSGQRWIGVGCIVAASIGNVLTGRRKPELAPPG